LAIAGAIAMILPANRSMADDEYTLTSSGMGSAETLMSRYQQWESESLKKSGDGNLILTLAPSNTFSTEKAEASGEAKINLTDGTVAVEVKGLARSEGWDVWIVDNLSGPDLSVLPETGDSMIKLGSLRHDEDRARLNMTLDRASLGAVDPDLVVITRAGKNPAENRVLSGSLTLFQELYLSKMQGRFGTINDTDQPAPEEKGVFARLSDRLGLTASAQIGPIPNPTTPAEQLITQGRNIFLNETFQGNGRTCATCHREENNFMISPQFIATLPIQDPLFVAETQPALSRNFENPFLLRKFALIKENVDGFDDLEHKFVFRATQHTLAILQNGLAPNLGDPCLGVPGVAIERTGWGGDGAPVGVFTLSDGVIHNAQGTLRDFAIGAIIQHFPRTLARRPRTSPDQSFDDFDFRLPTQAELNALEAFQRSLGRREDPDLTTLQLKGSSPSRGQGLFNSPVSGGKCARCHQNAGASTAIFTPEKGIFIANNNFDIGVENIPSRPTDENGVPIPRDGGFGARPDGACGPPQPGPCPTNGCGNGTFNTQVVVEAADTGPFFHNNAINTIEDAVAFYTSPAFNTSPAAANGEIGPINLSPTEVTDIAAFLRVLNTLENIRSAGDLDKRAKNANLPQGRELIRLAISELTDALKVLHGGKLHPEAQIKLLLALGLNQKALFTINPSRRNALLGESLAKMHAAVDDMVAVNVSAFQF
jgi:cytochrome c peroxidase